MSSNHFRMSENFENVPQLSPQGTEPMDDSLNCMGGIGYQSWNVANFIPLHQDMQVASTGNVNYQENFRFAMGSELPSEVVHQHESHWEMFHQQVSFNLANQPGDDSPTNQGTAPMLLPLHFHTVLYPAELYFPGPPSNYLTYRRHPEDPLIMIPTLDGKWTVYHTDDVHRSVSSTRASMDLGMELTPPLTEVVHSSQQEKSEAEHGQIHPVNISQSSHEYHCCSPILDEPDGEILKPMSDNEEVQVPVFDDAGKNIESTRQSGESLESSKYSKQKAPDQKDIDEKSDNADAGWCAEGFGNNTVRFATRRAEDDTQDDLSTSGTQSAASKKQQNWCRFCQSNNEPGEFCMSNELKDEMGDVACPILRFRQCHIRNTTCANAHTSKPFPLRRDRLCLYHQLRCQRRRKSPPVSGAETTPK